MLVIMETIQWKKKDETHFLTQKSTTTLTQLQEQMFWQLASRNQKLPCDVIFIVTRVYLSVEILIRY